MKSPFPYSLDNKRYHTYHYEMHRRFGGKVSRISLSAGMSCPNLDGTKGRGGCTFCSPTGSGDFAGNPALSIVRQMAEGAQRMGSKWDTERHIAYFQARTNTYAPAERLRELYDAALACEGVVGLAVATRPDCLPPEVCDLLADYAKRTYLTVELGLQTIHDETGERINRCHTYADFLHGYEQLRQRGILTGVHLINGLPGESAAQMVETAEAVGALRPHLVKIHLLYITEGTRMAQEYERGEVRTLTKEEYVAIVCDQLERLPKETVIGRLTGDGVPEQLIAPFWSKKKLCVLNSIDQELVRRGTWQGIRLESGGNC